MRPGCPIRTGRWDPEYVRWLTRMNECMAWSHPEHRDRCLVTPQQGIADPHHIWGRTYGDFVRLKLDGEWVEAPQLVPLCRIAHTEGHRSGWVWFQEAYELDLEAAAAAYHARYLTHKEAQRVREEERQEERRQAELAAAGQGDGVLRDRRGGTVPAG